MSPRTAAAVVVILGHGSPDPRSAAGLRALAREVARQRPGTRVDVAFLDHDDPGLVGVALELSWAGYDTAVVVPAFLTAAFHVTVDVPAAVTAARDASGLRLVVAEPIGPDLSLLELLDDWLPDGPVVLACAGTRDETALESLDALAREWSARRVRRWRSATRRRPGRPSRPRSRLSRRPPREHRVVHAAAGRAARPDLGGGGRPRVHGTAGDRAAGRDRTHRPRPRRRGLSPLSPARRRRPQPDRAIRRRHPRAGPPRWRRVRSSARRTRSEPHRTPARAR